MIDHHANLVSSNQECMSVENLFEVFWELYPRKVGKRKNKKKFISICKKDVELANFIIEQLKKYIPIYESRPKRYVPYPHTWLNQGRWEDDIESEYEEIF